MVLMMEGCVKWEDSAESKSDMGLGQTHLLALITKRSISTIKRATQNIY